MMFWQSFVKNLDVVYSQNNNIQMIFFLTKSTYEGRNPLWQFIMVEKLVQQLKHLLSIHLVKRQRVRLEPHWQTTKSKVIVNNDN